MHHVIGYQPCLLLAYLDLTGFQNGQVPVAGCDCQIWIVTIGWQQGNNIGSFDAEYFFELFVDSQIAAFSILQLKLNRRIVENCVDLMFVNQKF